MDNRRTIFLASALVMVMLAVCLVGFIAVGQDGTDAEETYAASVTIDGTTTKYATLEEAVAKAQAKDSGNNAQITLLSNTKTTKTLSFTKGGEYILDIGEYTLTQGNSGYLVTIGGSNPPRYPVDTINGDVKLTIKGTGSVIANNTTFRSYGHMYFGEGGVGPTVTMGKNSPDHSIFKVEEGSYLTVNGGTFNLADGNNKVTRIMQSFGTTVINNGTFNADVELWSWTQDSTDYVSTVTINGGTFNGQLIRGMLDEAEYKLSDDDTFTVNGGSFSDASGLAYLASGKTYTLIEDAELDTDVAISGNIVMKNDVQLSIAKGVTLTMNKDSVLTGILAGPSDNKLVANGMKAGTDGIKITGGSLVINGTIITESGTYSGANVTISGKNITISGSLAGTTGNQAVMKIEGTDTKVVFKNFEQGTESEIQFAKADGSTTTDPGQAAADVTLLSDVELTAINYVIKDIKTDYTYTGSAMGPTDFPGIEPKTGYTLTGLSLMNWGAVTVDEEGDVVIKPQTEVGTYAVCYKVTLMKDGVSTTYKVNREWSIVPLEVKITGSGESTTITKTYDGDAYFDYSTLKISSNKISYVRADAESKNAGENYDLTLVVGCDVDISNFKFMYGSAEITPVKNKDGDYELVLPDAATIKKKDLSTVMIKQAFLPELIYNGQEQNPTFSFGDGGIEPIYETDYIISPGTSGATSAKNAGNYTVDFKATENGNYTGSHSNVSWVIKSKIMYSYDFEVKQGDLTYTGSNQNVKIQLRDKTIGQDLVQDTDYTLSKTLSGKNAGTYTAHYEGKGNYTSGEDFTWVIDQKNISTVSASQKTALTYDGTLQELTIDFGSEPITDSDYTITGNQQTDAGSYTATLSATETGNYKGTLKVTWEIKQKDINTAEITTDGASRIQNGSDVTISFILKDDGKVLGKDVDYKIDKIEDKSDDKYDITILGLGNYTGTKKLENVQVNKSFILGGAGFYQNAEVARLALSVLGSTYSEGIDENTMFIVYAQEGYSESEMTGAVWYKNGDKYEFVYDEGLPKTDGLRTWLFSDNGQVEKKFVNGGTYKIVIYENKIALFDIDVYVAFKPHYTVSFEGIDGDLGSKTVAEGDSIVLPDAPLVEGKVFVGWQVSGEEKPLHVAYYTPKDNVTLVAVYDKVFVPKHSLDYYVIDATNYQYKPEYEYTGVFDVNAYGVLVTYTSLDKSVMNDFARYMGALYYCSDGEISSVYFNGVEYTWNTKGELKGSNWVDEYGNTLVSAALSYAERTGNMSIVMEISNGIQKQSLSYAVYEEPEPVIYVVTLDGYGSVSVVAGETITLPTISKLGVTFLGWAEHATDKEGFQGFYTPDATVTLYPIFATIDTYKVSTDYVGDEVTLAFNSTIAQGSYGLLVVTVNEKVTYDISLTNAKLAELGGGSYMIFDVTGDVVISVETEAIEPTGYDTFSIIGALADNTGFRVKLTSNGVGGLYAGTVKLVYTYSMEIEGKTYYGSDTTAGAEVKSGDNTWTCSFLASEGETMYYAYAEYTYTAGELQLTAQTLGVLAPTIPASTV